jgi:hypothetical protein
MFDVPVRTPCRRKDGSTTRRFAGLDVAAEIAKHTADAALTTRKVEVLRLVASRHANKESGDITRLKSEPPACTLSLCRTNSRDRL